jgi:hypothetical protein
LREDAIAAPAEAIPEPLALDTGSGWFEIAATRVDFD